MKTTTKTHYEIQLETAQNNVALIEESISYFENRTDNESTTILFKKRVDLMCLKDNIDIYNRIIKLENRLA